jgi:hypothetical protein
MTPAHETLADTPMVPSASHSSCGTNRTPQTVLT